MATSNGFLILSDFRDILQGVSFDGIAPANIRIRELPMAMQKIEGVPAVFICPYGLQGATAFGFESTNNVPYGVEVCLIDITLGQFGVSQEKRQIWQEQAGNAILHGSNGFRTTLPSVPGVWNINAVPSAVFDRSKLSVLYSYTSNLYTVECLE